MEKKWEYAIKKIYKTPGRAAVQVRFTNGESIFYKSFRVETASDLEAVEIMCVDEVARIEELYCKVDEMQK